MRPQPARSRGTADRPYSALDLRLALATFGLVMCAALSVLAFRVDDVLLAWAAALAAVVAAVDLVVVQLRRRARRRARGTDGPGERHKRGSG